MALDITFGVPLLIYLVILVLWVWALYDILFVNATLSSAQKVFWVIIVLLFSIIGIIFYVLLGRKESDYKIVKR